MAALFPDSQTRARVEREQSRLPLSYFEDHLVAPEGWDDRPGAYLAFGDTYSHERDGAVGRGWPVTTLAGDHLHLVNDPAQVATALIDLLHRMEITSPRLSSSPPHDDFADPLHLRAPPYNRDSALSCSQPNTWSDPYA